MNITGIRNGNAHRTLLKIFKNNLPSGLKKVMPLKDIIISERGSVMFFWSLILNALQKARDAKVKIEPRYKNPETAYKIRNILSLFPKNPDLITYKSGKSFASPPASR